MAAKSQLIICEGLFEKLTILHSKLNDTFK